MLPSRLDRQGLEALHDKLAEVHVTAGELEHLDADNTAPLIMVGNCSGLVLVEARNSIVLDAGLYGQLKRCFQANIMHEAAQPTLH